MSSQNRTGSRRKTITTISSLAIAGALVLTGCSPEVEKGWLPTERGTTSNTDRIMDLWVNSWIAALVVGIITWGLIVWCLEDSEMADRFFRSSGGLDVAEGMENFGEKELKKIGFVWS